uniref:F-box domain-containing protein n=1 Tax=Moniliophthora roreri TaxID=221103 RepID=A0A0W0FFA0_MONRR
MTGMSSLGFSFPPTFNIILQLTTHEYEDSKSMTAEDVEVTLSQPVKRSRHFSCLLPAELPAKICTFLLPPTYSPSPYDWKNVIAASHICRHWRQVVRARALARKSAQNSQARDGTFLASRHHYLSTLLVHIIQHLQLGADFNVLDIPFEIQTFPVPKDSSILRIHLVVVLSYTPRLLMSHPPIVFIFQTDSISLEAGNFLGSTVAEHGVLAEMQRHALYS